MGNIGRLYLGHPRFQYTNDGFLNRGDISFSGSWRPGAARGWVGGWGEWGGGHGQRPLQASLGAGSPDASRLHLIGLSKV